MWMRVKRKLRRQVGTSRDLFPTYMHEFMFRNSLKNKELFSEFLVRIATSYPLWHYSWGTSGTWAHLTSCLLGLVWGNVQSPSGGAASWLCCQTSASSLVKSYHCVWEFSLCVFTVRLSVAVCATEMVPAFPVYHIEVFLGVENSVRRWVLCSA